MPPAKRIAHVANAGNREEAEELITLLKNRMRQAKESLSTNWQSLKRLKNRQSLTLSGSQAEHEVETDIAAKQLLYDQLTQELEEAERRLGPDSQRRLRIVAPPMTAAKPVYPRSVLMALAICGSLLATGLVVLFWEWKNPAVFRIADVARELGRFPLLVLPEGRGRVGSPLWQDVLAPIRDAIAETLEQKNSVVIQLAGPASGEGKSAIGQALLSAFTDVPSVWIPAEDAPTGSEGRSLNPARSLEAQLRDWRQNRRLIVFESPTVPPALPCAGLIPTADVVCIVLAAGKTLINQLPWIEKEAVRLTNAKTFIVLNRFEDPLPPWLLPS